MRQKETKKGRYYHISRRKFCLKVHLVLVTKYRKPLLCGNISDDVKQYFFDLSVQNGWKILKMETDRDHIHILLEYDTTESVSDIVRVLKQNSTYRLWKNHHSFLSAQYWKKRIIWSDDYFACSVGEVSETTILHYIENQG